MSTRQHLAVALVTVFAVVVPISCGNDAPSQTPALVSGTVPPTPTTLLSPGGEVLFADDLTGAVQLAMVVNDAPLLEATVRDDQLTNGAPGMSAWTFPVQEQMDIIWHSFTVRSAPA